MSSRKSLKSRRVRGLKVDRITNLPDHVTDQILSCLPIKDAAKTSVLSNKWRHKWETVPCLVLNEFLFPSPDDDQGVTTIDKLVKDIDRILLLRSGPLLKFELSYHSLSFPTGDIDKWIRHVCRRHSLKEFVFSTANPEEYKIASCMFSCENLTHLDITGCLVRPPPAFKGFKYLKSLKLRSVTMAQDVLECLVSCSLVLEVLVLRRINDLSHLNINAPNLQILDYLGFSFVDIRLKNAARLHVFSVGIFNSIDMASVSFGNLVKLLGDLPQVRQLRIEQFYLQYLATGDIPRELPVHCFHLDFLSICVNLSSCNETSALLCLLRSVPNLQTLQLVIWDDKDGAQGTSSKVWEADGWDCPFKRLRRIIIGSYDFESPKCGMDLVKFMLSTTPVLESMVISLNIMTSDKMKYEIAQQLCSFERVSPKAKVICK